MMFSLRAINKTQNEQHNKRTRGRPLEVISGHPKYIVCTTCREALWTCGMCLFANLVVTVLWIVSVC